MRSLQWLGDASCALCALCLLHIPVFMVLAQTRWQSPTTGLARAMPMAARVLALLNGLQRLMGSSKAQRSSSRVDPCEPQS